MRKDISYGVEIGHFDEIRIRVDAVVEAVEVEEVDGLCSVIFEFCEFASA